MFRFRLNDFSGLIVYRSTIKHFDKNRYLIHPIFLLHSLTSDAVIYKIKSFLAAPALADGWEIGYG